MYDLIQKKWFGARANDNHEICILGHIMLKWNVSIAGHSIAPFNRILALLCLEVNVACLETRPTGKNRPSWRKPSLAGYTDYLVAWTIGAECLKNTAFSTRQYFLNSYCESDPGLKR